MSSENVKKSPTAIFFKATFEIDEYLSKCTQKSDLLTLRNDLKHYGQEVYLDMIGILKLETDSIVDLAEDLTSLNAKIDDLAVPVAQLKEQIRGLHLAINHSELDFKQQLDIAHIIGTKKDLLNLRIGILSSLTYIQKIIMSWQDEEDLTVLERTVNEYSFQYLYSHHLGIDEIIKEDFVINIAKELIKLVQKVFLKGIISNDCDVIVRCLTMYGNLDKQKDAERFVRENLVRPALSKIFTLSYLNQHNNNMQALYNEAMNFLNTDLNLLCIVIERNPETTGFNFVINSFWVEVDKQLRENLPNITAPGNPEFFQTRYQHTQEFLDQIIASAKTSNLYEINSSFEAHMKRFNLPVYFEIRFQQIAAKFEAELWFDPIQFDETMVIKNSDFMLKISSTLWSCIKRCLHEKVYLVQLSDQLFKLLLLLMSRYIKWYETVVKWPEVLDAQVCLRLEKFVMFTFMDIIVLKKMVASADDKFDTFTSWAFKTVPSEMRSALFDIFRINNDSFESLTAELEKGIVNFKIQQSTVFLHQVTSIPRIYRRTNRSIPFQCSSYVCEAVLVLISFYNCYKITIEDITVLILDRIVAGVSNCYIELVQEVLKSVCKTEESLKRLKNRNTTVTDESPGQSKTEGMSDETKIREQIKLDVTYFVKEVQKFSKHSGESPLKRLLEISDVRQT